MHVFDYIIQKTGWKRNSISLICTLLINKSKVLGYHRRISCMYVWKNIWEKISKIMTWNNKLVSVLDILKLSPDKGISYTSAKVLFSVCYLSYVCTFQVWENEYNNAFLWCFCCCVPCLFNYEYKREKWLDKTTIHDRPQPCIHSNIENSLLSLF